MSLVTIIRLSLYLLTFATGIAFFAISQMKDYNVVFFLLFLGLLTIFESLHPNGYGRQLQPFIPRVLGKKVEKGILIGLKVILSLLGIFITFLAISLLKHVLER